jgi:hypothetical protein
MDYCGVSFTAVESAADSSWSWQLLILDKGKLRTSGNAASRAAAIKQAREAIGEGLRTNSGHDPNVQLAQLLHDLLHILHGARSLPSAEAVAALRPLLDTMRGRASGNDRLADASIAAVDALVRNLETEGAAADDQWQVAIESSLSFANEIGSLNAAHTAPAG